MAARHLPLLGALLASSAFLAATAAHATKVQIDPAANTITCAGGCSSPVPFTPTGAAVLAVTTTTARVALPSGDPTVLLTNNGASDFNFKLGNVSVTAATTDFLLPAGRSIVIAAGANLYVAAIAASGTSSLSITTGTGSPTISGGGGSGSGTATTTTAVSGCARAISAGAGNPFVVNLFNALCIVNVDPTTGAALDPAAATPAGTNHIGSYNLDPSTTGGCTPAGIVTTASTNTKSVKGSPGTFCGGHAVNTTATLAYIRWYDLAAAPTCSSATGFLFSTPVPASATGNGLLLDFGTYGAAFTTGIAWCVTGGGTSTDNTNAAAGVYINYATK